MVGFSGGKDSIVLYDIVKRSGVKYEVFFNMTTVDPPEVLDFIRDNYSEVKWNKPKKSMFSLIKSKFSPPTSQMRYCCTELKEIHGLKRVVVTGIRWAESVKRSKRDAYEQSKRNAKTYYCNPIIDWTDEEIWEYIHANNLVYPSLYDEGYTRIGCIMCPLQSRYGMLKDAIKFPRYYNAYMRSFKYILANFNEKFKNEPDVLANLHWKTPEDIMFWWVYHVRRDECKHDHWKLPDEDGFDLESIKPRPYNRRK